MFRQRTTVTAFLVALGRRRARALQRPPIDREQNSVPSHWLIKSDSRPATWYAIAPGATLLSDTLHLAVTEIDHKALAAVRATRDSVDVLLIAQILRPDFAAVRARNRYGWHCFTPSCYCKKPTMLNRSGGRRKVRPSPGLSFSKCSHVCERLVIMVYFFSASVFRGRPQRTPWPRATSQAVYLQLKHIRSPGFGSSFKPLLLVSPWPIRPKSPFCDKARQKCGPA